MVRVGILKSWRKFFSKREFCGNSVFFLIKSKIYFRKENFEKNKLLEKKLNSEHALNLRGTELNVREINSIDKSVICSSLKGPKITCSFLIPLDLMKRLPNAERRSIGKNINFLLRQYGRRLKENKRFSQKALTIKYQKAGKSLIKVNSRIFPEEWAMLSVLASSHGISRCFLYCILIQIFLSDRTKRNAKILQNFFPSKFESFIWSIDLKDKVIRRILYEGSVISSS
ncbi:DUF1564 family protein [Leptospira stimsonii]